MIFSQNEDKNNEDKYITLVWNPCIIKECKKMNFLKLASKNCSFPRNIFIEHLVYACNGSTARGKLLEKINRSS